MKIYQIGNVNVSGQGIANDAGSPTDLQWYIWSTSTADFAGSTEFRGFIYHPQSDVKFTGGAQIYGGAYARDVESGQPFHYDEDLRGLILYGPAKTELLAWKEAP